MAEIEAGVSSCPVLPIASNKVRAMLHPRTLSTYHHHSLDSDSLSCGREMQYVLCNSWSVELLCISTGKLFSSAKGITHWPRGRRGYPISARHLLIETSSSPKCQCGASLQDSNGLKFPTPNLSSTYCCITTVCREHQNRKSGKSLETKEDLNTS